MAFVIEPQDRLEAIAVVAETAARSIDEVWSLNDHGVDHEDIEPQIKRCIAAVNAIRTATGITSERLLPHERDALIVKSREGVAE